MVAHRESGADPGLNKVVLTSSGPAYDYLMEESDGVPAELVAVMTRAISLQMVASRARKHGDRLAILNPENEVVAEVTGY